MIQNQIMYGTKLIANSAIKLSRKKYRHMIVRTDIRSKISISGASLNKFVLFLDFYVFFAMILFV